MLKSESELYLVQFGNHLQKLRTGLKFSRVQLAFEIGTNEKHLRLIEKSEISTGLANLFKISKALNISMTELFDF